MVDWGHSVGISTRDNTARIRILQCEPEPVKRAPRRWHLPMLAALVAIAGIAVTALVASPAQPGSTSPAAAPAVVMTVEPVATVNVASFRHTPAVHRTIRSATMADLSAAARAAAPEPPTDVPAVVTAQTGRSSGTTPGSVSVAQAPQPPAPVGPDQDPAPRPAAAEIVADDASAPAPAIGPEQPGSPDQP